MGSTSLSPSFLSSSFLSFSLLYPLFSLPPPFPVAPPFSLLPALRRPGARQLQFPPAACRGGRAAAARASCEVRWEEAAWEPPGVDAAEAGSRERRWVSRPWARASELASLPSPGSGSAAGAAPPPRIPPPPPLPCSTPSAIARAPPSPSQVPRGWLRPQPTQRARGRKAPRGCGAANPLGLLQGTAGFRRGTRLAQALAQGQQNRDSKSLLAWVSQMVFRM